VNATPNAPVYFLLHVPKAAGQTIELHLIEHGAPGMVWIPRQPAPWEAIIGARHGRGGIPDLARVRVVSGHYLTQSLERRFPGREIRRAVLLRDPVSLCVSLYNYRMMSYLARGRSTYGFALHRRTLPRDFVAHFLLSRWLERRSAVLLAMRDQRKYDLLNQMLLHFWFVGAYRDADRLVAAMAPDLGVPAAARRRNSTGEWQRRTRWRPLTTDQLSAGERAEIIADNPIDWALWQNWRDAGFAAAGMRPSALEKTGRGGFLAHELTRPAFILMRRLRRDGWRGLSPIRGGLPSGLVRADRARDHGDWRRAARYYQKALAEEPDAAAIWVQYGHALKEMGDAAAAEAAYRKSLQYDPDAADTWLQLGHALKIQARPREAAASYRHALALDAGLDAAARELAALDDMEATADGPAHDEPRAVSGNFGSE
jgi:tetratricopeptide (TPR) repeat protein